MCLFTNPAAARFVLRGHVLSWPTVRCRQQRDAGRERQHRAVDAHGDPLAAVASVRLALTLLGLFAASALALAAVGIYGVMSYSVKQRSREIGTRLALGAIARVLSARLVGTSPADPLTLSMAAAVLLGVALLACYVPARRATRVGPVKTLANP